MVCAFAVLYGCAKKTARLTENLVLGFAGRVPDAQRFIAVRHKLQIVASESQLHKS
jgi:20S proteasome alpha/beta subunit